jgi:dihydrofolate synthase / folylpolyglutamate synthase
VGGTNGKGSVVGTLDALLRATGLRVGRYTSPHLIDFRERIVVNGCPIEEEAVVDFVRRWTPEVERLGATFFEATTCMAFDYFARSAVDVAVIEVGLGGRLDATNVLKPRAAGVTSVGLDHMQYLGETIEDIAREKAGIFKAGVPAAIGEQTAATRELLISLARAAGARPVCAVDQHWTVEEITLDLTGTSFTLADGRRRRALHTPLIGRHQAYNTSVALSMLEMAGPPFAAAAAVASQELARVAVAGRFQRWHSFILDVSHNPAGVAALCDTLLAIPPPRPLTALLAVLGDKDWREVIRTLGRHVDRFILTAPPSAPHQRAWRLEEAAAFAAAQGWHVRAVPDFERALVEAQQNGGTTLVTGSFHTVGAAMACLQVSPLSG